MNRYVVVDTETTGFSPHKGNHRIIEIALVEVVDYVITGKQFQTYLNPQGKKSLKGAFKTHQIKDDSLIDKPLFSEVFKDIISFIGDATLIFYNKDFDLKFLDHESMLADHQFRFSESFKSRCLLQDVSSKFGRVINLDAACSLYRIDISERKIHGALIDSILTAKLLIAFDDKNVEQLQFVPNKNKHTAFFKAVVA